MLTGYWPRAERTPCDISAAKERERGSEGARERGSEGARERETGSVHR